MCEAQSDVLVRGTGQRHPNPTAQGGEKAHHLLHTGYKKVDVYTFEK